MLRRVLTVLLISMLLLAGVMDNRPVMSQGVSPEEIQIEVPPTIRTIEFAGNTLLTSDELRRATGIRSGQLLTESALIQAIANIRSAYAAKGYVAAVTGVTFPEPGEVGTLRFEIQEQRPVETVPQRPANLEELTISAIRITGLKKTREDVIRGILLTQPGSRFNRREVQADAARLLDLGIFSSVEPELEFISSSQAVLLWKLQEKEKLNYAELGGSIGQPEGLIVRGSFTFANIGGRADKLKVEGYVGTLNGQPGGKLSYYNPLIAPNRTSLLLQAYSLFQYRFSRDFIDVQGSELDPYFERRNGVSTIFARPTNVNRTQSTGLRLENAQPNNLPPEFLTNADNSLDSTVFVGSLQSVIDFRDSIRYPTRGTLTTARLEAGYADVSSGNGGISKIWADKRWLFPLKEPILNEQGLAQELVPVIRLQAAAGTSLGNLPFTEQYFVGGVSALPLRGYPEDRFWGKNYYLAGAEYRYPFSSRFVGVAFVDTGDAWNSDYQFIESPTFSTSFRQHKSFSPRVGAGVGARYFYGNTPVALDFAYGENFRIHIAASTTF